jgi:hypothetical protein
MAAKQPNKLYAIYAPNGDRVSYPKPEQLLAWGSAVLEGHIAMDDSLEQLQQQGYVCAEVRIERVVRTKARKKVKA